MKARKLILFALLPILLLSTFACGGGGEEEAPTQGKIAFTSFREDSFDIYVMDADGSNQTNLTNDVAWDKDPSWSP